MVKFIISFESPSVLNISVLKKSALQDAFRNNSSRGLTEEKVVQSTDTLVNPEIISIGNGRYLIVSTATDNSTSKNNVLHFFIYDEPSISIVDSGSLLKRAVEDAYGKETADKISQLTEDYEKIDHDAVMADCEDDILIA